MRTDIYSSSCSNNRIELNSQSGRQKGTHSEPPPKDSANAKAVGVYLQDPSSLFVPWTMASFFSAADIVFLVTVLPSQRVLLRSSYQQSIFQTFFIVKYCGAIFLRIFVIKPLCKAMGQRVRIGHDCDEGLQGLPL
jgi:hypothetical protein